MSGHTDVWFNATDIAAMHAALGRDWLLPGTDGEGNSVPAENWFQPPAALRRQGWQMMPGSYGAKEPPILLITQEEPQQDYGGFTIGCSAPLDVAAYDDLPAEIKAVGDALILACSRDRSRLLPIYNQSARLSASTLRTIRISRTWAGHEYHFREQ